MFVNQNCLRHLLRPWHYTDPGHYAREENILFRRGWQFAATRSELARDGDFLTLELYGTPLLIRRFGDDLRAFVNVCPHRHCMLRSEPRGNAPRLVCQYHGWEYKADGHTGKIPEAKAFRPWDRDNSQLESIRLKACGDLLFVCLDADEQTPSLEEWASPFYDAIAAAFSTPLWRMAEVWEFDCECNWKIPVENTLESYHVAAVHPKWLGGDLPAEKFSEHQLDSRYSSLRYDCDTPMEQKQADICVYLGGKPDHSYRHWTIHPNTSFVTTDTFNYLATCQPISPTRCRLRTRMYALHGSRKNLYARLLRYAAWRVGRRTMRGVFNEDRAIFDAQQKGIAASRHRGVIGTREERIYAFQKYLCDALELPIDADPAGRGNDSPELLRTDDANRYAHEGEPIQGCERGCESQPLRG